MAKSRPKSGGRDFKPGNKFGKGRPPTPPDLKTIRQLDRMEFERLLRKFSAMNALELRDFRLDQTQTVIEHIIASICEKAVAYGDQARLEFITEQLFGKLPNKTEHTGTLTLEQLVTGSQSEG